MEIRVRLEAVVSLQDGEVSINEVLHAVGKWGREVTVKVAQGTIAAKGRCAWAAAIAAEADGNVGI